MKDCRPLMSYANPNRGAAFSAGSVYTVFATGPTPASKTPLTTLPEFGTICPTRAPLPIGSVAPVSGFRARRFVPVHGAATPAAHAGWYSSGAAEAFHSEWMKLP